jgi:GNAT superfamily N-acetyltransferase
VTEIRRVAPDEWQTLRAIRLRALADFPDAFGSTVASATEIDEAEWRRRIDQFAYYLAWPSPDESAAPVGLAAGYCTTAGAVPELISMWVSPPVRGAGVATELVTHVADWARSLGSTQLMLWVVEDNPRAIGFYRKLGFQPTGQTEIMQRRGVREQQMKLSL